MNLLLAELRKVWGDRVFPLLVAVLAAANLLLLWMGTRPVDDQPLAAAYRAVGAELAGLSMAEKGALLHEAFERTDGLLTLKRYYRDLAYSSAYGMSYYLSDYRANHADLFEKYEQLYKDVSYTLYTGSLETEYRLFKQLADEYDTVAGYGDFLDGVQIRAGQLAGISIFQNDASGYDIENIELTAQMYAGLGATPLRTTRKKDCTPPSPAPSPTFCCWRPCCCWRCSWFGRSGTAACWAWCAACPAGGSKPQPLSWRPSPSACWPCRRCSTASTWPTVRPASVWGRWTVPSRAYRR